VPVVQNLEKKLDIMQGLDPLMDGIIERMNQVTDHSEVRKLQAQQNVEKTKQHLDDVLNRANENGLTVHLPLTFETPKERKIRNVLDKTLGKLEPKDHLEAVAKIGHAAATGQLAKDLMGSDTHTHTDTVVDHSTSTLFTPPTVTHHTTTTVKSPEDYMPAASVITSTPPLAIAVPQAPHVVVPIVPAAIPVLAANNSTTPAEKLTTPGIMVDKKDRTTTILTNHKNEEQTKKYQNMVKAQNDEN
jgi:hypothetical protein